MGNVAELDTTRLVIAAIIGLALLLVLIIKFKVHAMLSILIGAIAIGLIAGMPFEEIVTAVDDGIGNTLRNRSFGRTRFHVWCDIGSIGWSTDAGSYNGKEIWR